MIGEIWTYKATKPNDNSEKVRPVLVIGNDEENGLNFVDINYVIISSSAQCGKYDIELKGDIARVSGLEDTSIIKTTKIYTGSVTKLGKRLGILPLEIKNEFEQKYIEYQSSVMKNWHNSKFKLF